MVWHIQWPYEQETPVGKVSSFPLGSGLEGSAGPTAGMGGKWDALEFGVLLSATFQ